MSATAQPPQRLPELIVYQGAFGRLCALAAEALQGETKHSREAVAVAWRGEGENIHLAEMRRQRGRCKASLEKARLALSKAGVGEQATMKIIVDAARESRDAVESEWGSDVGTAGWCALTIPITEQSR